LYNSKKIEAREHCNIRGLWGDLKNNGFSLLEDTKLVFTGRLQIKENVPQARFCPFFV